MKAKKRNGSTRTMTADPADPFREPALTTHPSVRAVQPDRRRAEAFGGAHPRATRRAPNANGSRPADAEAPVEGRSDRILLRPRAPSAGRGRLHLPDAVPATGRRHSRRLRARRRRAQTGAQGAGWSNNGSADVLVRRRSIQRRRRSTCTTEIDCAMSLSPLWRASSKHPLKSPLKGRSWIPLRMDAALPTGPFHRRAHGRAAPHLPELRGDDVDQSGLLRDPDIAPVPLRSRASAGGSALKNRT